MCNNKGAKKTFRSCGPETFFLTSCLAEPLEAPGVPVSGLHGGENGARRDGETHVVDGLTVLDGQFGDFQEIVVTDGIEV